MGLSADISVNVKIPGQIIDETHLESTHTFGNHLDTAKNGPFSKIHGPSSLQTVYRVNIGRTSQKHADSKSANKLSPF